MPDCRRSTGAAAAEWYGSRAGRSGSCVPDLCEVRDVGPRAELFEHAIPPLLPAQSRHAAARIREVAEDDGVGRADLLARRLDVPVGDGASVALGLELARLNALHAQAALLHHAARADGDVGIQHHLAERAVHVEVEAVVARVLEPVEPAYLVWTVVLAVPRADAAVVDLLVEDVGAVHGREHRTDRLAWRVAAVLAHHRLHERPRRVFAAGVVAIDPDPVHLASAPHFIPPDDRDVVLRLARRDARRAAGARREIDRHPPVVLAARTLGPQRRQIAVRLDARRRRLEKRRERRLLHDLAPFHRVMRLRRGERIAAAGARHPDAGAEVPPGAVDPFGQRIGV